jgi:uncharacterized metal-binding protein YceD (DUF177 family)
LSELGKFDPYKVPLKSLSIGSHTFEYILDSEYFKKIDSPEVQRGKVTAKAVVKYNGSEFEINFQLEGVIIIACDRCLDDMELPVNQKSRLIVIFGTAYSEESDEIIVIPEDEGEINLAWFLYEFIVLSIPIKHVHAPGKCNKLMSTKLKKHTAKSSDDESEDGDLSFEDAEEDFVEPDNEQSDPRWDELKNIIDNN